MKHEEGPAGRFAARLSAKEQKEKKRNTDRIREKESKHAGWLEGLTEAS